MDVKEVLLPGVGLRFEFENRDGYRIGVVARRTGDFEVLASPGPAEMLRANDVLVVIGTEDGISAVEAIIVAG